jgi:hypothetical protein
VPDDDFTRTLLYSEMPRHYTSNQSLKKFQRRKQGQPVPSYPQVFSTDALERLYTVHPSQDKCFYLRLLLVNVRGPTSFQHLRTVNDVLCGTYREAYQYLGLLENDTHWDHTLEDAVILLNAKQIQILFSIILSTCFPSTPIDLWNKYIDHMTEDILHQKRLRTSNANLQINEEMYNEALTLIEDMCLMLTDKGLIQLGITAPNRPMHNAFNQELRRETQYDSEALK